MAAQEALERTRAQLTHQLDLRLHPLAGHVEDFDRIYLQTPVDRLEIGRIGETLFAPYARANTVAVLGGALGDEGKGRFVDNQIETLLARPGVESVWVVRYQGGNNAGHTIERNGLKLALHVVPSFVLHEQARGVMDQGEIIHPEDLQTEVDYIEGKTGESIAGRLFLSRDAILCSDLERAEETLNRIKSGGKSDGGTGRGIGPASAHAVDRTGTRIRDLMATNWQQIFERRYEQYERDFAQYLPQFSIPGHDVHTFADILVPDFRGTKLEQRKEPRTIGTKEEFIARLGKAREWLLTRDMVVNTHELYDQIVDDPRVGVVFEASQAAGLDIQTGTYPDVTSSDTTLKGIDGGTGGYWKVRQVSESVAVIKATYTSSVGKRHMPTEVNEYSDPKDQVWTAWVQNEAHEYGTTTGRPRDIDILDLPMLRANLHNSGAENVVLTHLDIARVDMPVKICTHYLHKETGLQVPYSPHLDDLKLLVPQYIELPGWDGEAVQKAHTLEKLPENARRYIAFLQARLGYHIVAATTGPDRDNLITFPGYTQQLAA